ncbi:MAG: OmpH family outer membrane protein [Bacteroidetes bacterium]|jgi:outer membrane protein|nr:MAG: OmpH family outer membrane protein [Bacteroidota bacterium]
MRLKSLFATGLIFWAILGTVSAQNIKIGYANIQAILAYMPETNTMEQQLQTYESKLAESLQIKQRYLQEKYAEYQEKAAAGADEATLKPLEEEIVKLDKETQQAQQVAQDKALAKRQELMAPIVEKLQKEIDAIAKEEGYTYILNAVDGSGISVVLHGPEEHDLTKKILTRLGIAIPAETPAATTGSN